MHPEVGPIPARSRATSVPSTKAPRSARPIKIKKENKLVRELKDVAGKHPIFETIATQGQDVVELLDGLFTG